MTTAAPLGRRRRLNLNEVPLPPGGGFTHDLLEPTGKALLKAEHQARVLEITRRAVQLNERASHDPEFATLLIQLCKKDIFFFIEHFCWCHEPRTSEDHLIVLYPYQAKKVVEPYVHMRDTPAITRVVQLKAKSRDMGITWAEMACRVHSFLFRSGWTILLGCVTKGLVDDGGLKATHESLFGKVRFILEHLPRWMRDELLGPGLTKDEFNKKHLLINPMDRRNFFVGAAVAEMFGRSGRYSEAYVDEFAYCENIKSAEKAIKQTTSRFSGNSTPQGRGNLFEQLMFSKEMRVQQYWIWWPEHPDKDLNWYNDQREQMEDVDVASELDISFDESLGGRVLPDVHVGQFFSDDAEWTPTLPVRAVIDFGASHPMAMLSFQWDEKQMPPCGRFIDFVQIEGVSVDWIVPFITGTIPDQTWRRDPWPHIYSGVEMEMIARARQRQELGVPTEVFGDWQGSNANTVTGAHSAFSELGKYGIYVTPIKIMDDYESIIGARQFMRHVRGAKRLLTQRNGDPRWCPSLAEVLTQWVFRKPKDGETQHNLSPVHNRFCHGGDCIKMAATTVWLPDESEIMSISAGKIVAKRGSDLVRNRWQRGL